MNFEKSAMIDLALPAVDLTVYLKAPKGVITLFKHRTHNVF